MMNAVAEPPVRPAAEPPLPPIEISVDDRRKYLARIPVELELHVTTVNHRGTGRSVNLSVTGLLLETEVEMVFGERLILTIMQPDGQPPYFMCAEVSRVAPGKTQDGLKSYGLRILTDDAPAWHSLLRRLVLS